MLGQAIPVDIQELVELLFLVRIGVVLQDVLDVSFFLIDLLLS